MKLQINVPVSGLDLAALLQGEEGFFLCQNRGQNYITVAKSGHSIAFGPTLIGRIIQEQPSLSVGPEPGTSPSSATRPSSPTFVAQPEDRRTGSCTAEKILRKPKAPVEKLAGACCFWSYFASFIPSSLTRKAQRSAVSSMILVVGLPAP